MAYDGAPARQNHFYSANWGTAFIQFDKTNPSIDSCANVLSAYGAAWDNDTLWIASQDVNPTQGNANLLTKVYWPTCTAMGTIDGVTPPGWTDGLAGGCDFAEYQGMYVIFEMIQGTPTDVIVAYYLRDAVTPYMCADVNGSGSVTSADGYYILNWHGGGPSPVDQRSADVNGDCSWSTADAFHLLNYFGMPGSFPLNCDLCWPGCTNCD
jgi:hypothetical protein